MLRYEITNIYQEEKVETIQEMKRKKIYVYTYYTKESKQNRNYINLNRNLKINVIIVTFMVSQRPTDL